MKHLKLAYTLFLVSSMVLCLACTSHAQGKVEPGTFYFKKTFGKKVDSLVLATVKMNEDDLPIVDYNGRNFTPQNYFLHHDGENRNLGIEEVPTRYVGEAVNEYATAYIIFCDALNKLIYYELKMTTYLDIKAYSLNESEALAMQPTELQLIAEIKTYEKYRRQERNRRFELFKDGYAEVKETKLQEEIADKKLHESWNDDPTGLKIVQRDYKNNTKNLLVWHLKVGGALDSIEINRVVSGNSKSWGTLKNDFGAVTGQFRTVRVIYRDGDKCSWAEGEIRKMDGGQPFLFSMESFGRVPCEGFLK